MKKLILSFVALVSIASAMENSDYVYNSELPKKPLDKSRFEREVRFKDQETQTDKLDVSQLEREHSCLKNYLVKAQSSAIENNKKMADAYALLENKYKEQSDFLAKVQNMAADNILKAAKIESDIVRNQYK